MSYPPPQRSSADHYASVPLHELPHTPGAANPSYDELSRPKLRGREDSAADTFLSEPDPFSSQTGLHSRGATPYSAGANTPDLLVGAGGATAAGAGAREKGRSYGGAGGRGGAGGSSWWGRKTARARRLILLAAVVALVVIAVAVAVPVAVTHSHSSSSNKAANNAAGGASGSESSYVAAPSGVPTGTSGSTDWRTAATGGDGSTIYLTNGSSFVYNNTFGGFWNAIPFNDSARAQADVPALNEQWDYTNNLVQGVNIGGWLVVEPFIVPGMFEPYNSDSDSPNGTNLAIDEWTLSEQLGASLSETMTAHYETFITEQDFAQIAGAGLNWVRIPIGWWAIETWSGEPFLAHVSWDYFLRAVGWARKYGLRINLDFHAVPGSQNGYNHSGKQGSINFLNGVMGLANAQRTLDYVRTLTEFISQAEYKNVIPMFSILNEPYAATIGVNVLRHYYSQVYTDIRAIAGIGTGNGPFIVFHDGFVNMAQNVSSGGWTDWDNGMDRAALDSHNYLCFTEPNTFGLTYQAALPCNYWATNMNTTRQTFGFAMGGEWSLAINDCGKWLNNVGNGQRYDGTYYIPGNTTAPEYAAVGSCDPWNDYTTWNASTKAGFQLVAAGHMSALRHFFFWTWKTGFSQTLGKIANPMWNYQLGLSEGYVPTNPRTVVDACPSLVTSNGFSIAYTLNPVTTVSGWMTGGAGAGTYLNSAMYSSFSAWPPPSIGTAATPVSNLPTYTQTGPIITMSASTPTSYPAGYSSSANVGSGWVQPSDSSSFYTNIPTCSYPNAWSGAGVAAPTTAFCASTIASQPTSNVLKRAVDTLATPVPSITAPARVRSRRVRKL